MKKNNEQLRSRLERLAKNITGIPNLTLQLTPGAGSYSSPTKRGYLIVVDPAMASDTKDTESFLSTLQGITAHEAGHLCYSDFSLVEKNVKYEKKVQQAIPEIAGRIDVKNLNQDVLDELKTCIHDYIRAKNMHAMFNSIEDGGVEHLVPIQYPRMYGPIVLMRNSLIKKEMEYLRGSHLQNVLQGLITEMRHFATYAYREKSYRPVIMPRYFTQEQIDEIKNLCIYGRLATQTSAERLAVSEVLMDYLEPELIKKTDEFYDQYMKSLLIGDMMSGQDLLNMANAQMPEEQELVIQGQMDPKMAKSLKPQKPPKSEYTMDLPQKLQDKINQKMQEQMEQEGQNRQSSQSGEKSSSQSNKGSDGEDSSSNSGENEQSSEKGDTSDKSGQSSNKNSNEDKESQSDSEKGEDSENSSNSSNEEAGSEEREQGDSKGAEETNDEADNSGEKSDKDSRKEDSGKGKPHPEESGKSEGSSVENDINDKTQNAKPYDPDEEKRKADDAVKESLRKLSKELEHVRKTELKHQVEGGNGTAPKLQDSLGDVKGISNMHKVPVEYYSYKKNYDSLRYPEYGEDKGLQKQASQFSKKLKEELMYQAKTRRKNGLKAGKLNDSALSRIITDQRCFRKTIEGIDKKARFEILLDLSGSMYGQKVRDAVQAAYMLSIACAKIKVPVSVMGHNADETVYLHHFLEFEDYLKPDSRKNILKACAGNANRDGLAIFHAATDLVRHRKKDEKLMLLVISDGAPSAYGYSGKSAFQDIQNICDMFEKEYQVHTIGIGIGDDTAHVPTIYKDYVLVPNVEELGDQLLNIIKKAVL